ncbi:phytanoyl-CoA dioxygenase family protein [Pontibacter liquoris]|uniref:phytanoyl-CoA dioxygenase family protein n=1 Tax=Pontibacter liquoris TaxID=2905677 RepID=UPI001FA72C27|nr:phytanoyl-CoA dioxygenase family protein [Pontibacter liquoris]
MKPALSKDQIRQFINQGYTRLNYAFPEELAARCRSILWQDTGCAPDDPATWTQPVIRLGDYAQEPFRQAANTPLLHAAFDQLVGRGNWLPRHSLGTFPVRFPSSQLPNDTGWHVDASFPGDAPDDFLSWRVNVFSKDRALLLLFLFSDVTERDAPTRLRPRSHLGIARLLAPAGEAGLTCREIAANLPPASVGTEVSATGKAGTVYLCHPFLVHAAQAHHGSSPRFMAQPPLYPARACQLQRPDNTYMPLEKAIRKGLGAGRLPLT